MQLSIVIVSYNVCHYLIQCLRSVEQATRCIESEVWVVDNASTDDSVKRVRELYPSVLMIANKENVGFARANNMALREASGDFVLLLNPDTVLSDTTLTNCIRFMLAHKEAGALGAHMVNRDGTFALESRRGLPTPATAFYKMSGLARLFPRSPRFGRYHMRFLDENQEAQIDVISGAFFFARREAIEQVGLLDEDYFMYGEDVDLSYRLTSVGWQNWYLPQAIVLHYKGESTQKTSYRYVRNFYNAMLIFFRKHFARRYRLTTLVVWPTVVAIATLEITARKIRAALHSALSSICGKHHAASSVEGEETYFIGDSRCKSQFQQLTSRVGLTIAAKPTAKTTYIVYDAESLPYGRLLENHIKNSKHLFCKPIGFFYPSINTLILPNDVIC